MIKSKRKPSIKILQDFTNTYFTSHCPVVRWKKMKYRYPAMMNLKTKKIYLNPKNGLEDYGCWTGIIKCRPAKKEKIKYRWGEQYFHALLHEIAHFKIKEKPPKEWVSLMGKFLTTSIENLNAHYRKFDKKPATAKEEKEYVRDLIKYYYPPNNIRPCRRTGESNCHYLGRCKDFRHWLVTGDYSRSHVLVEKWSRKEFRKRRKEINEILLNKTGK